MKGEAKLRTSVGGFWTDKRTDRDDSPYSIPEGLITQGGTHDGRAGVRVQGRQDGDEDRKRS